MAAISLKVLSINKYMHGYNIIFISENNIKINCAYSDFHCTKNLLGISFL